MDYWGLWTLNLKFYTHMKRSKFIWSYRSDNLKVKQGEFNKSIVKIQSKLSEIFVKKKKQAEEN